MVPTGGALSTKVARRMAEPVVAAGTSSATFHRVQRGETISEIADEYGVTQRELLGLERLGRPGRIRIGQRIRVSSPDGRVTVAERAEAAGASGEDPHRAAGRNAEGPGETLRRLDPGPQGSKWTGGAGDPENGYRAQDSRLAHRRLRRRRSDGSPSAPHRSSRSPDCRPWPEILFTLAGPRLYASRARCTS